MCSGMVVPGRSWGGSGGEAGWVVLGGSASVSDILTTEIGKMARFIFRACRMGSGGKTHGLASQAPGLALEVGPVTLEELLAEA
jgi:hypothetical protein